MLKTPLRHFGQKKLRYYHSSENPTLLILSGTHGDEGGVVKSVEKMVEEFEAKLPPFLFIPEVSPSAIKLGTRINEEGFDLNRKFVEGTDSVEAKTVMDLLAHHKFDLCLNFHEDPEFDVFYVYDVYGEDHTNDPKFKEMLQKIKDLGVGLLTGVDDPSDPVLGEQFVEGYAHFPLPSDLMDLKDGIVSTWLAQKKIVKRHLTFEIPGKLEQERKDEVVRVIFTNFFV